MYFPSKKDLWLNLVIWVSIIICFMPLMEREYVALFLTLPIAVLLIWLWFSTGYEVNSDILIIRSGPFKKSIPIKDIKKIRKTNNLQSSFALSIDRLEITYGPSLAMALVSPKDKREFVSLLKSINPRIIDDNNKKE